VNGAPAKETVSKVNKGKAKKTAKPDSDEEKTTAGSPRISVDVPQRQNSASQAKADHDRELEEHDDGPSYVSHDLSYQLW